MSIKNTFLNPFFSLCIILPIQANNSLKSLNPEGMITATQFAALQNMLEAQSNRLTLLEGTIAKQQLGTPSLLRIRSLSNLKDWAWQNKGTIALTGAGIVTFCVIKTLWDNSNERLDRLQDTVDRHHSETTLRLERTDARLDQITDNQGVLLHASNRIIEHLHAGDTVAFNQHNIPDVVRAQPSSILSPSNIANRIIHAIGNTTISMASTFVRSTWSLSMRAAGNLLS